MHYGLQIAASGMLTALYRVDVHANNLANVNTVGFKPDVPSTKFREPAREEDGLHSLPSNELIERLGAGVLQAPNRVSFKQGSLQVTENALDLAIEGDGFFVLRELSDGQTDSIRLTRDGRFATDSAGRLVNATTGLPVLTVNNRVIQLRPGVEPTISADGQVRQEGELVGRLQLIDVPDRSRLRKIGEVSFSVPADAYESRGPARGRIRQGALEGSAVDEIGAVMKVQGAARAVSGNSRMVQLHDELMDRAINTFARTA